MVEGSELWAWAWREALLALDGFPPEFVLDADFAAEKKDCADLDFCDTFLVVCDAEWLETANGLESPLCEMVVAALRSAVRAVGPSLVKLEFETDSARLEGK